VSQQQGGPNIIETKLVFKSEASSANQAIQQMTQQVKTLDRSAQAAQLSLSRMSAADRAIANRAAGGDIYNVPGMPQSTTAVGGQSRARAYYQSSAFPQAQPPPLPSHRPGGASPAMGGTAGGTEFMALAGRATAAAGAIVALAHSIEQLGQSVDRAGLSVDSRGNRLTGTASYAQGGISGIADFPLLGYGIRAGAGLTDRFASLFTGHRGIAQERLRQAGIDLDAAGPKAEYDTTLGIGMRYTRSAGIATRAAEGFADYEQGRLPLSLQEYSKSPELFTAGRDLRRASFAMGEADKLHGAASADVVRLQRQAEGQRQDLANRRDPGTGGGVAGWFGRNNDQIWSGWAPTAGMRTQAEAAELKEKEVRLTATENALREAIDRKQASGVELAQRKLEVEKQGLGVMQARMSLVDREIERQKGGAVEFALMDPGAQQSLRRSVEKLQRVGPAGMATDELRELAGSGLTGEMAGKQIAEWSSRENLALAQILEMTGQKGYNQQQQAKVELQGEFIFKADAAEAAFKRALQSQDFEKLMEKWAIDVFGDKLRNIEIERGQQRSIER
jgi:hypothetical protein